MKEFSSKTRLICGAGSLSACKQVAGKRVFLVCDPYFVKDGTAGRLASVSEAQQTQVFSEIKPDPTVEQVAEGSARLKAFQPDTVIALGGGSTMDCAKAMVYFSGLQVCFVAIPTTAGSGSEMTDFSVLTHNGVKHPLVDEKLRPDVAILDGELLRSLPPSLIADTGFDVISHGIEALTATGSGTVTDALARDAVRLAVNLLAMSYQGNLSVRQKLLEASAMAGMAFTQAGLGLCHAMAHSLGGMFHIPHGRLNAILLPAVITTNSKAVSGKYAELTRAIGYGGAADTMAVRNLKNGLIRLRRELNMPATLAEAGIEPCQVWRKAADIVAATLADPCCRTNPVQVEDFTVRRILEEVTGRD